MIKKIVFLLVICIQVPLLWGITYSKWQGDIRIQIQDVSVTYQESQLIEIDLPEEDVLGDDEVKATNP